MSLQESDLNPMAGRDASGSSGEVISSRIASNTTLNWASYFLSSSLSFRANPCCESTILRSLTKARMMATWTLTARSLVRTPESMATPCSVNTSGKIPSPTAPFF